MLCDISEQFADRFEKQHAHLFFLRFGSAIDINRDANPALPQESAAFLAEQKLYVNEAGLVGPQTLARWSAYSGFLFREGLLADANGKPLTTAPDYGAFFTNEFLPGGP